MSDHYRFDLTGVPLEKCMEIAFGDSATRRAVGWTEEDQPGGVSRLVLYWTDKSIAMGSFPAHLDAEAVVPVVRAWLSGVGYGAEPDHDGSNRKGWRVYNERYGQVGDRWQAFVAIEPTWLEFGK